MLQDIRDRASGWIAWTVIVLIAAAFATFGLSQYMGPSGQPRAVATVNDQEISRNEAGQAYRNQRQQVERMYGGDLEITEEIDRQIRRDALQQLIDRRLLAGYLNQRNMTLSDQDLAAVIRSQEMFHEGGRFSRERYQQMLRANQLTTDQYEQQVRRQALSQQVRSALSETGLVTEREVDELLRLEHQERDVGWLRVAADDWRDEVSVSDDEIEAYYDEHRSEFATPERVRLAYLELTREALLEEIDVSDDDIESRYEQVKAQRYAETGRVEARHILVRVDEDADADTVADAEERIEALYQRLRDGESFAELAEEYSEDPGSARRGGDLGEVRRGDMVEAFEEALFALDEGEISEPVRSPFGFHVVEATTMERGETTPLAEVRDEIRRELAEERISTAYFDEINRLDDLAYDMPDSLQGPAEEMGLEVRETDWLTRDGAEDGIGAAQEVVEAAFDPEVLEDGMNSRVIEIDDERAVVVRVAEHEPQAQLALDEVRDDIAERLRARGAGEAAESFARELMDRVRDGDDAETIAEGDERVGYQDVGWITRQDGEAPWPVLNEVFRMSRPDGDRPELAMIPAAGDRVVVLLRGVRDGDPDAADPEERRELADRLRGAYGQEAVEQFLAQLRADADVEVHDEDYR